MQSLSVVSCLKYQSLFLGFLFVGFYRDYILLHLHRQIQMKKGLLTDLKNYPNRLKNNINRTLFPTAICPLENNYRDVRVKSRANCNETSILHSRYLFQMGSIWISGISFYSPAFKKKTFLKPELKTASFQRFNRWLRAHCHKL